MSGRVVGVQVLAVGLGATTGVLIAVAGGNRGSQLNWAMSTAVGLTVYLTLVGIALTAGQTMPQAVVAAVASVPLVVIVGGAALLAVIAAIYLVFFAVPVTVVLTAIFLWPPLSFVEDWEPEVIAAINMVFVVLWFMLLERVADVVSTRRARRSRQGERRWRRRAVGIIVGILGAVLDFIDHIVDRLTTAESSVSRWLLVLPTPEQALSIGLAGVAALFAFAPLILVEYWVFGSDFSASHEAGIVTAAVGAVVGGAYGAGVAFVALVAAGVDD